MGGVSTSPQRHAPLTLHPHLSPPLPHLYHPSIRISPSSFIPSPNDSLFSSTLVFETYSHFSPQRQTDRARHFSIVTPRNNGSPLSFSFSSPRDHPPAISTWGICCYTPSYYFFFILQPHKTLKKRYQVVHPLIFSFYDIMRSYVCIVTLITPMLSRPCV